MPRPRKIDLIKPWDNNTRSSFRLELAETYEIDKKVAYLVRLLRHYSKLPRNLAEVVKNNKRVGSFKSDQLFRILNRLSIEAGFIFDYYYEYEGSGGHPVLCAYMAEKAKSLDADWCPIKGHSIVEDAFAHIQNDGTPEGFIELALLRIMGCQFYQFWHALYNDIIPICGQQTLSNLIEAVPIDVDIIRIQATPRAEIGSTEVRVELLTFSQWIGLDIVSFRFNKDFPHIMIEQSRKNLSQYDCGLRF